MRRFLLATMLGVTAVTGLTAPAAAQSYADEQRWQAAQSRFRAERQRFLQERDRYYALRGWNRQDDRGGYGGGYDRDDSGYDGRDSYGDSGYGSAPTGDDRYDNGYDASRYYRAGPNYQERALAADDRVYRGSDGRYYCRRNDGTTGLIVGAAGGGILGNVIDGGHSRAAGTLIGGAIGALVGRSVDQQNSIRCR